MTCCVPNSLQSSLAFRPCKTRHTSCTSRAYSNRCVRATCSSQEGSLTQITLKRPLGLTFAEDDEKRVFVEALVQGGNAESSGKVQAGDILSKISAVVLKSGKENQYEKEGYGQRPYDNWDTIMFDCIGQDFDTVMSALDSNNPRWGINTVTLVLQKPQAGS